VIVLKNRGRTPRFLRLTLLWCSVFDKVAITEVCDSNIEKIFFAFVFKAKVFEVAGDVAGRAVDEREHALGMAKAIEVDISRS